MDSKKIVARTSGVLFLLATITYIAGSTIFDPTKGGHDTYNALLTGQTNLSIAAIFMLCTALSNVTIGILMFSLVRKYSETIAISYVVARIFDCGGIALISLTTLATLVVVNMPLGSEATTLGPALITLLSSLSKEIFIFTMIGLGIGSIPFCYLLFRQKLIPTFMSILGILGYFSLAGGSIAEYFHMELNMLHYVPGAIFEVIFPLWLIVKGLDNRAR